MAKSASELPPKNDDVCDGVHDAELCGQFCCSYLSFRRFGSARCGGDWERISPSGGERQENDIGAQSSWWLKRIDTLKKVREWSELVAGPKWKTFIRRFNRSGCQAKASRFQYDAFSYSLNFDEGRARGDGTDSDVVLRDFSSRYAAIPATNSQSKNVV